MATDYKTEYSREKNINTLDRGSYNDWGDGTPARQVVSKQAPGEIYEVNIVGALGDSKAMFNEVASVAVGGETLLNTYTVPTGKNFAMTRVLIGGENIGKYLVKLNDSIIATNRTWWTNFNQSIAFDNLKINADDKIEVFVINRGKTPETFESTIIGDEY